eukprot:TRINITY_DN2788_c3_g2_i1.p1 TRINITY_DN2788_c3_g2~~TRINITY_DN2788_c3_g2_i1.p1  ORF type:complete len:623 (-),score=267.25 TRINITY_DN2788_c3_g2_i1:4-1872(-)
MATTSNSSSSGTSGGSPFFSTSNFVLEPTSPTEKILIFVNSRSGGQQGETVRSQVLTWKDENYELHDLSSGPPAAKIQEFQNRYANFKIWVCGGDGTICWILSAMEEVPNCCAPIAILPLGTGNDISRTFGWGPGYEGEDLKKIFDVVKTSECILMDRWKISIEDFIVPPERMPKQKKNKKQQTEEIVDDHPPPRQLYMNAYFGIGIDAYVAYEFHRRRQANPERFTSRAYNKSVYTQIGVSAMVHQQLKLHNNCLLKVDGEDFKIPNNIFGIVILNLPSWGAGKNPWKNDRNKKFVAQSVCDKKFEIVGFTGIFHMGAIQAGISKGKRLKQGYRIEIETTQPFPIQVDGEAWMMKPSKIKIKYHNQSKMLINPKRKNLKKKFMEDNIRVSGEDEAGKRLFKSHVANQNFNIQELHAKFSILEPAAVVTKEEFYDLLKKCCYDEDKLANLFELIWKPLHKHSNQVKVEFVKKLFGIDTTIEEQLRISFEIFDENGDKMISRDEMKQVLWRFANFQSREPISEAQLLETLKYIDFEEDDQLSFKKFLQLAEQDSLIRRFFSLGFLEHSGVKPIDKNDNNSDNSITITATTTATLSNATITATLSPRTTNPTNEIHLINNNNII